VELHFETVKISNKYIFHFTNYKKAKYASKFSLGAYKNTSNMVAFFTEKF